MKILLVNTSKDTGGAAVACHRLMDALTLSGAEVRLITSPPRRGFLLKAVERLGMLPFVGFSRKKVWSIDVNWLGTDITETEVFRWADVVHIHWVNQGMLSVEQIGKIAKSGKRVVWTMHDLWPLDSIYHYKNGDERYAFLENSTMKRKMKAYANSGIAFVTCSRWLMNQAKDSTLLQGNSITSIPNPIDTNIFFKRDKIAARRLLNIPEDIRIVAFVSQKLTDERKGARYFIEAVNAMDNVCVAIMGANGEDVARRLHVPSYLMGYISDQERIAMVYSAADVFVLPSLNDNLPNTIMEAMACGVPCVGFDIGGIPEMIDHEENGYIAEPRNAMQLKDGIEYCLCPDNNNRLSTACLEKVKKEYSQESVAEQYLYTYKAKEKQ